MPFGAQKVTKRWPQRVAVAACCALLFNFAQPASSQQTVYVDDFGAVGDGLTSDTAAIQAAINAAGQGGRVVFTAGKTYAQYDKLVPGTGQTFLGNGATLRRGDAILSTLIADAPAGATHVVVDDPTGYQVGMGLSPVRGAGAFPDGESYVHPQITGVIGNEVHFNVPLSQSYSAGDRLTSIFDQLFSGGSLFVDGLVFDGNRENNDAYVAWTKNRAINGEKTALVVRNSVFENMPGDAILVDGMNFLIEHNVFSNSNLAAAHFSTAQGGNNVVRENLFVGTNQQADRGWHSEGVLTISTANFEISIADNFAADAPVAFVGRFTVVNNRWAVERNNVYNTDGLFFAELVSGPAPYDIALRDNYAEDSGRSYIYWPTPATPRMRAFDFSGNTINGGTLELDGLYNSSVQNNLIRSTTGSALLVGDVVDTIIDNNELVTNFNTNAGQAALIYNARDGSLVMDASLLTTSGIARFVIGNNGKGEGFLTENLSLPYLVDAENTDVLPFLIAQYGQSGSSFGGRRQLGKILPTGLTAEELQEFIVLARFTDGGGRFGVFDLQVINLMTDLNDDGAVDIFDVGIVSEHWADTGAPGIPGDANLDGLVNIFDLGTIHEYWMPNPVGTSVPEPSTVWPFVLGGLALLAHRRQR